MINKYMKKHTTSPAINNKIFPNRLTNIKNCLANNNCWPKYVEETGFPYTVSRNRKTDLWNDQLT